MVLADNTSACSFLRHIPRMARMLTLRFKEDSVGFENTEQGQRYVEKIGRIRQRPAGPAPTCSRCRRKVAIDGLDLSQSRAMTAMYGFFVPFLSDCPSQDPFHT